MLKAIWAVNIQTKDWRCQLNTFFLYCGITHTLHDRRKTSKITYEKEAKYEATNISKQENKNFQTACYIERRKRNANIVNRQQPQN